MQLQRCTDASGDGPGVRCLRYGPASTQSTDPSGVCDSATPTRQHTCSVRPGRAGASLQEEEHAQNHAVYTGVNAVLHTGGIQNNKNTISITFLLFWSPVICCMYTQPGIITVSVSQCVHHLFVVSL